MLPKGIGILNKRLFSFRGGGGTGLGPSPVWLVVGAIWGPGQECLWGFWGNRRK